MEILSRRFCIAAAVAATALLAWPAAAHHGWSWTDDGFFEIKGRVVAAYVGNPHATIDVDAGGEVWRVELAPPAGTAAAGFTERSVAKGAEVTAIGHRSRDAGEKRMKAVRVIVGGKTYDVYPDRVPEN